MAASKKKKDASTGVSNAASVSDDLAAELIADLNKEFGTRVAYNLSEAGAPTIVKGFVSSGSLLLDYAISNRRNGGYPWGRIIEVAGLPSTGKSHLAYEAARNVQEQGGLVVYIDTDNATSIDKLHEMGIDVHKKFVYVDSHCTEEVFALIDSIIKKAKSVTDKGLPVFVVWDSIAGTSPKEELEGAYDKSTMGLNARVLSKGMRKLTGVLGNVGAILFCINQLRTKFNVMFGDPYVTPGGAGVPFHSSVRIRLTGEGTPLKNKNGDVIGIKVPLKIIKNKIAPPHRTYALEIHFGKGINETDTLIDVGIEYCEKNDVVRRGDKIYKMVGKGKSWKTFLITSLDGEVLLEKKFTRDVFEDMMKDPEMRLLLHEFYDTVLTVVFSNDEEADDSINPASDEEVMCELS